MINRWVGERGSLIRITILLERVPVPGLIHPCSASLARSQVSERTFLASIAKGLYLEQGLEYYQATEKKKDACPSSAWPSLSDCLLGMPLNFNTLRAGSVESNVCFHTFSENSPEFKRTVHGTVELGDQEAHKIMKESE